MPMLDLEAQQQHMTVFRLRFGEKGPKGEPRKLTDRIRVTSPSLEVVERFVEVLGGEARPWESGGKGPAFEAYLPVTEIPVYVLPGQSIRQSWEKWRGGSQIERRCDGMTEEVSGNPCMCPPDLAKRMASAGACKPTTYVTVICPTVSITWAGDFVSRGMTAAKTLPGSVNLVEELLARGQRVPATLRIVEHPGSRNYVIPVIIPVRFTQEMLDAGEVPALPNGKPAQISGAETRALEAGGGTQAPGTRGGPAPRPAAAPPQPPLPHEVGGATGPAPVAPSDDDEAKERAQRVAMMCKDAKLESDDDRHAFLRAWSGYRSSYEVPADKLAELGAVLVRFKRGELVLTSDDPPVLIVDHTDQQPTLEPPPAVVDVPLPEPPAGDAETHDQAWWLQRAPNLKQSQLVRQAKAIGDELGVKVTTLQNVPAAVAERLEQWIEEQG